MKDCPVCGGNGAFQQTAKGVPFVECTSPRCRAAAKPAPTEALAERSWDRHVRAFEGIPGDWSIPVRAGVVDAPRPGSRLFIVKAA